MRRRLDKTWADYVAIAVSPALIMLLVGSLMFFLIRAGYSGDFDERLRWVMGWFVIAIVLIGRISMEEGAEKAVLYGLALTGAMALAVVRFIQQPIVAWVVLGIVWWSAHKLTWDCTLIDEEEDASGEGLLQVAGLDEDTAAENNPNTPDIAVQPADTSMWRQLFGRRRRKTSAPGVWVVYFSLAALPLFGLGQRFIPADNVEARRAAFLYLIVYVGSALGLLLSTAFLGLRRYLRQRKLAMPPLMTSLWIGSGAALIVLVLAVCAVIPRPSPEYAAGSFTGRLTSDEQEASPYAVLRDSGVQDPTNQGAPGHGEQSGSQGTEGQGSQGQGSQGQGSQGQGSQGQGSQGQGQQGQGSQSSQSQGSEGQGQGQKNQSGASGGDQGEKTQGEQTSQGGQNQPQGEQKTPSEGEQSQSNSEQAQAAENNSSEPSPSSDWMPSLSDGIFLLGRWILNLILILAALYVVIRYGRQLVAGFQQLLAAWRKLWAGLFGRRTETIEEETLATAQQRLPAFADFPNPFERPVQGVRTPEEVVAYSFRALQAWAAEHGNARLPQETPWEFADRLGQQHTAVARPVRELATLFARLNYAGQRLPAESLESVRHFWDGIELLEASFGPRRG